MANAVPYQFLNHLVIKNQTIREIISEFLGTLIVILFGAPAFAQEVFGHHGDIFAITWCWGIGIMLGIYCGSGVSGGHVNPAVTTSFASIGIFPWKKVPHYLLGQHLGAFVASALVYSIYKEALDNMDGGIREAVGTNGSAIIFAAFPRDDISIGTCFLDTVIASAVLMFTIHIVIDERNTSIPKGFHAFLIGLMVTAVCLAYGHNCMATVNPARDFGGRVFAAMGGWGSHVFAFRQFWIIGLLGPHVGGAIGSWLYYLGIQLHFPRDVKVADERELKELLPGDSKAGKNSA